MLACVSYERLWVFTRGKNVLKKNVFIVGQELRRRPNGDFIASITSRRLFATARQPLLTK